MLFQMIVLVTLMMVITYAWPPARRSQNTAGGGRSSESPFRGRHRTAPPKKGNHTIDKGSMTRCHNCSCFFPMGQVVHDIVEGHLLEFCSTQCRTNFLNPK